MVVIIYNDIYKIESNKVSTYLSVDESPEILFLSKNFSLSVSDPLVLLDIVVCRFDSSKDIDMPLIFCNAIVDVLESNTGDPINSGVLGADTIFYESEGIVCT